MTLSKFIFGFLIVGGLPLGIGLYECLPIMSFFRRRAAGADWPATTGKVVSKYILRYSNRRYSGVYFPKVIIFYRVDGKTYHPLISMGKYNTHQGAQRQFDRVGAVIPVHYNPEKPAEQITEYEQIPIGEIILSFLFLALGLFFMVTMLVKGF